MTSKPFLPPHERALGEGMHLLNALTSAVCDLMGWADGDSLRARITRAAPDVATELGLRAGELSLDPRFVRAVAERATVNETYFFRHAEQLAAVCAEVQQAFPSGMLTCWSAGCSTGEEPYSLAMQFFLGCVASDRLEVLGTDVSASALDHARMAHYPEWSFRGVPRAVREQCFSRVRDTRAGASMFEVEERFRRPVRFASHNLLSPPPLRKAQLISCRNALIYMHPTAVQAVLRQLDSALVPGGFLMLGTAEQHFAAALGYETFFRSGLLMLRKPVALPDREAESTRSAPLSPAPLFSPERGAARRLALPAVAGRGNEEDQVEAAWTALRAGLISEARVLAEPAAEDHVAEAHFVLATLEEQSGQPTLALEHLRRAIYLDPTLISAHATQAMLFRRLGRKRDASRARANALRYLAAVAPETILCGIHPLTARELKAALEAS